MSTKSKGSREAKRMRKTQLNQFGDMQLKSHVFG